MITFHLSQVSALEKTVKKGDMVPFDGVLSEVDHYHFNQALIARGEACEKGLIDTATTCTESIRNEPGLAFPLLSGLAGFFLGALFISQMNQAR